MTKEFDHILLKIWFAGGISRNLTNVVSMTKDGNVLIIRNDSGTTYLINFDHVSMIEEIHQ